VINRRELFNSFQTDQSVCAPHPGSFAAKAVPNIMLRTHEDKKVKLYDDLMRGRQVLINMMYASCESGCPLVTSKLVKVHKELKDRMGKDLFMYSISLKPEQDDPAALKRFAQMHGALLPGWTFLTGDPYDIETIRFKLFAWRHIKLDLDLEFHTGMVRIINDATNCWTMVNPYASMFTVLEHISWADPPKSLEQRIKENYATQERINEEVKRYGYRKTT
jgi:protein SCO1